MQRTKPIITILTINFGSSADTLRLLENLKELSYPLNKIEILLIDNIAHDDDQKYFKKWISANKLQFKNIQYFAQLKNPGLSLTLNFAFSKISKNTDYLWRLDNDTLVEPDSLQFLLNAFVNVQIGIVGSRTLKLNNGKKTQQFLDGGWKFFWPIGYARKINSDMRIQTDYCTGASFMTKMSVARELGYLADPAYFAYFEDADFCLHIKKLGYSVLYEPQSVVYHKFSPDSLTTAFKVRLMTRNRIIFMRKNAPSWFILFLPLFTLYGPLALALHVPTLKELLPALIIFSRAFFEGIRAPLNKSFSPVD